VQLQQQEHQLLEQRLQLEQREQGLSNLKQQLLAERDQQQLWREDLMNRLKSVGGDFCSSLSGGNVAIQREINAVMKELKSFTVDLKGHTEADSSWFQTEHRKFAELSTEVATLREMTSREFKERQEVSKGWTSEVQEVQKRLADLKSLAKSIRDLARKKQETPTVTVSASEFRLLPAPTRLVAMVSDGAVLWLLMICFLLGTILMLGVFTEMFKARQCQFRCSPLNALLDG